MKTCTKCNELKSVDEFFKDRNKKSGLQSHCKACSYERQRLYKWRVKNDPASIRKQETYNHRKSMAKLEVSDIILIRGLFDFLTIKSIAEKFEVTQATIRNIKNRKSWSWVK